MWSSLKLLLVVPRVIVVNTRPYPQGNITLTWRQDYIGSRLNVTGTKYKLFASIIGGPSGIGHARASGFSLKIKYDQRVAAMYCNFSSFYDSRWIHFSDDHLRTATPTVIRGSRVFFYERELRRFFKGSPPTNQSG